MLAFIYAHIFKKGRMRRIDLVHGHEPSTPPLYYICYILIDVYYLIMLLIPTFQIDNDSFIFIYENMLYLLLRKTFHVVSRCYLPL